MKDMEREELENLLIDYIDGKLSAAERQAVEQELVNNEEAYKLYEELREVIHAMDHSPRLEPPATLKENFDKMLQHEIAAAKPDKKTIFFTPAFYRVAAAVALLVLGGGAGFWISTYQRQQDEIARLKEDMERTKQTMMAMIGNNQSASQRLQGVSVALTISAADDEVVRALVRTMNEDPNTNVRMAALDALSKFYEEPAVRKALIKSLEKQKDPIVQMALIQLLVRMKEKGVVNDLKRIVDDKEVLEPVKDEAYTGIMKLS
jgi:anti-sigma-K factor RskA